MKKNISENTDIELVKMLQENTADSEKAFTELYERYSSMIHAYCLRIMHTIHNAEDIFQETFIKFYEHVKQNNDVSNIPGYLITIARNQCLNYRRDLQPTVTIEGFEFTGDSNIRYENQELLELITMALNLLDFDYREAFVLREYDGLQYNEIAELVGTTTSNAKSRVHRAKLKVKEILMPYLKELIN